MFPANNKELILRKIKSHLGFKKDTDFANFLGISPSALNMWYARKAFDYDIVFTKCVGIDANFLLTGEGNISKSKPNDEAIAEEPTANYIVKKQNQIPLIPISAMAGFASGDVSILELDTDYYSVPEFKNKADYLIRISGNSMYPKYNNGDVVACKKIPLDTFFQWGKVYVMDTVQGPLCKRIESIDGNNEVLLISENEKYKPFKMHRDEIRSLAIVIGVIRLE